MSGASQQSTTPDLTVKGESVESTYRNYTLSKYWVNRRYQRKLIWALDEKQGFIDSIIKGYPVPIILLAENKSRDPTSLEIIDGMQRLNAVMSFIENDFSVGGKFFDLNTMAATKELLDQSELEQKTPILERQICVQIASYALPFSIYEFADERIVDEVFRRINSGGRKLSPQELRTAGATGHFATTVRQLASQVRGDATHSDVLRLNDMAAVSITNRDLNYGIPVDGIFWVKQNILTKEQVRESRDEEIIADILAYMLLPTHPSSRSEFFDDYYGAGEDSKASQDRYVEIELAIQKRTPELVIYDFLKTFDALRLVLSRSNMGFGKLLFKQRPARAPRYFQAVFLAFYTLIVRQSMAIANWDLLIERLNNGSEHIKVPEGGRWLGADRHSAIQGAMGTYTEAFAPAVIDDPATTHWVTKLENLMSQSLTEQGLYDFKQGFLRLDGSNKFDEGSFEKILKTCVGIANNRKGRRGYVLVGISDKRATTAKVKELFNIDPLEHANFGIVGVEHEAGQLNKDSDQFFQFIVEKIFNSKLSSPLKEYVTRNLKPIRYFDKTVYIFEVEGQEDPSSYAGVYYDRQGTSLETVGGEKLAPFMRRYLVGR